MSRVEERRGEESRGEEMKEEKSRVELSKIYDDIMKRAIVSFSLLWDSMITQQYCASIVSYTSNGVEMILVIAKVPALRFCPCVVYRFPIRRSQEQERCSFLELPKHLEAEAN